VAVGAHQLGYKAVVSIFPFWACRIELLDLKNLKDLNFLILRILNFLILRIFLNFLILRIFLNFLILSIFLNIQRISKENPEKIQYYVNLLFFVPNILRKLKYLVML
jgi:hypothetical protein